MHSRPKRKKPDDPAFNPRKQSHRAVNDENALASMFAMRAGHAVTQVSAKGGLEPVKNSFLVKQSVVPLHCSITAVNAAVVAIASRVETYRPVGEIVWENGSPVKVFTPHGKTPLPRTSSLNMMSFFSNNHLLKELRDMPVAPKKVNDIDAFIASNSYKNLIKILTTFKEQTAHVSAKALADSLKERRADGFKRASQAKTLTEPGIGTQFSSAATHIKAAQLIYKDTIQWEWLHLVAHLIWAERSQTSLNLVAGTFGANTEMLMPETLMPFFAKKYPHGFDLEIHADLIEPTHIAYNISYTIKAGSLVLPLKFNPLSENNPQRAFGEFFSAVVKSLVEEERKQHGTPDASNAPLEGHFYRPPGA